MLLFFWLPVVPGVTLGESTQVVTAGQRRCGVGERSGKAIGCARVLERGKVEGIKTAVVMLVAGSLLY